MAPNNATTAKSATIPTYGPKTWLKPVYGGSKAVKTDREGRADGHQPPLSVTVYQANARSRRRSKAPSTPLAEPPVRVVGGRAEIAPRPGNTFVTVTFGYRPVGTTAWQRLGSDDNAPYRVFQDVSGLPKGTLLEYRVLDQGCSGNYSVSGFVRRGRRRAPAPGGGGGRRAVVQPANVSVPGDHNMRWAAPATGRPTATRRS